MLRYIHHVKKIKKKKRHITFTNKNWCTPSISTELWFITPYVSDGCFRAPYRQGPTCSIWIGGAPRKNNMILHLKYPKINIQVAPKDDGFQ